MSSLSRFGVPIPTGNIQKMGEPKAKNKFRVILYGFGVDEEIGESGHAICYETNSVDLPKFNVATYELHQFDNISNIAGKMRWQSMNLTVKDTVDNTPAKAIVQQIQRSQDFNRRMGQTGIRGGYKFEMWIQTLTGNKKESSSFDSVVDGIKTYAAIKNSTSISSAITAAQTVETELFDNTIDTWICSGCVLTDVDFGEKDYSTSDYNVISLSILPDNCVLVDSGGTPLIYDTPGLISSVLGGLSDSFNGAK